MILEKQTFQCFDHLDKCNAQTQKLAVVNHFDIFTQLVYSMASISTKEVYIR